MPLHENHGLDTDKEVFFYEQDFYVLSNFSSFNLQWAFQTFPTSEHAYQWEKFTGSYDNHFEWRKEVILDPIKTAPSAHVALKLAERYVEYRNPNWSELRIVVMRNILQKKVLQHEYVYHKLMQTGDRLLIENSYRDDFWGWGPNKDGQNMLGKLWMEIRADLADGIEPFKYLKF